MGAYITCNQLTISSEKVLPAYQAVLKLSAELELGLDAVGSSLQDVFRHIGYPFNVDGDGNIDLSGNFRGKIHPQEEAIWKALTPFVEPGGNIIYDDDNDDERKKLVFDNGKVYFQAEYRKWNELTELK